MKLGWFILFHLLGVACIAADIAVLATLGQMDLSWLGWLGVGFYWTFAVGIAMGWKRFGGRPLTVIILGFYVLATMMLLGIAFSNAMGPPTLLLAFAPLVTAFIGRIILDIIYHTKRKPASASVTAPSDAGPSKRTTHDTLFRP